MASVRSVDGPVDPAASQRLRRQRTANTAPETRLRKLLHARGLRFRTEYVVGGLPRRRMDIVFTRARLAVLVDGCFWHGCPEHCVTPKSNTAWWTAKIRTNRQRDRDTDAKLAALGWSVLRIWEHTPPESAADTVERTYRALID